MYEQLTCSDAEKVTIDVDNGGFKVKGSEISVEFQKLTKQTAIDDDDMDMMADDETI